MSWLDLGIRGQRLFFYGLTAAAAGSVFVVLLLLIELASKWKNSRLKIWWIKAAMLFYLIPIASVFVIGTRTIILPHGGIAWVSDFWMCSTLPMKKVYFVAGSIWLFGMILGIGFRIVQYWKLKNILKGNIPLEDDLCERLIKEYKEKNQRESIEFYQNDSICFPMTVGSVRSKIILPVKRYTEKELHMVLEHELNHVKRHDLLWKKAGLLITFLHWWNPLSYILLEKLILQEEIECDIRTCENNEHFTMKEYGLYLAGMPDDNNDMIFASALCKSKKDLFRRLEGMVRGKKHKKRTVAASCLILSMLAVIPSYAASEGVARMNEKWIAETEVATEVEAVDYHALEKTAKASEDESVEEIDLTLEGEVIPLSTEVTLDYTIKANTRVLYNWWELKKGKTVFVSAKCNDSSITYRIGIKDSDGNMTYKEGNGNMNHIFTVSSDGKYAVYVENRSNTSMQVTGWARYSD